MEGNIIVALIAVMGTLIGIIYQGFRSNKQDKGQFELLKQENKNLKERIEERHTSGKAGEYHKLTTSLITSSDKLIVDKINFGEKAIIEKINTSRSSLEKDIEYIAKDFKNQHDLIKNADSSEGAISSAIKSIENLAANTGALKEENMMLKTENSQCLNQLNSLNRKYETILEENKELKQQIEKLMNIDKQKEYQQNNDSPVESDKNIDNSKEQSCEGYELDNDFDLEL